MRGQLLFACILVLCLPALAGAQDNNDSFATADLINFGQTVSGAIDPEGDIDYYEVNVTTPGVIEAELSSIPNGFTYRVTIFDSLPDEISSAEGSATEAAVADQLVCETGTYYVRVNESGGFDNDQASPVPYELTVTFDDSDEQECNNSFSTASLISFGETQVASIYDEGDFDYYEVNVTTPGVIEAELSSIPNGFTYRVTIFDSLPDEISSAEGSATEAAVADQLVCETGTYYVRVNESGGFDNDQASPVPYELTVTFDDSDEQECNNEFSDASTIEFGETQIASIYDDGDFDYYKVNVPTSGVIKAELTNIPSNLTYRVTIFDSLPEEIGSDQGDASEPAILNQKICEPGTHYIRINESGGFDNDQASPEPYNLTVTFNNDDAYECNDEFGDATSVNPCLTLQGNILPANDRDCYEIDIASAGDYSVLVQDVPGNLSMDVEVFDEFGDEIAQDNSASDGASVLLDFTVDQADTYIVCLEATSNSDFNEELYSLTFQDVTCSAVPEICGNGLDDDEDGNIDCEDGDCDDFPPCDDGPTDPNCSLSLNSEEEEPDSCGTGVGVVRLTPTNGTGPFQFTLSGAADLTESGSGPVTIDSLPAGSYTVTVTDADDCTAETSFVIDNIGAPVIDGFDYDITDLTVDFSFDTAALSDADSLQWDFGDGATSTDTFPSYTYAAEGEYTVTLTLFNACGPAAVQEVVDLEIVLPPPSAGFTASETEGCAPLSVTFTNTSTDAATYRWVIDGVTPSLYNSFEPGTINFEQPGAYIVRLIAENADGVEDIAQTTIEVQDVPVADFDLSLSGTQADITNLSTPGVGLIDVFAWDFGDGTTSSNSASSFTHFYPGPGNYTLLLVASNGCGADTTSQALTVEPNPGSATLDIGENEGFEGEVVSVPVVLKEFVGELAAIQGTIEFEDAGVGSFSGFQPGLFNAGSIQFNTNNGQFSALAPNSISTDGTDTLFSIDVLLVGDPGDSTDLFVNTDPDIFTQLEVTVLENGVIGGIDNLDLAEGRVRIFESADLDGLITFWEDNFPVNLVDVNLDIQSTGIVPDSTQTTGPDGTYFFDNVDAGENIEIYCEKATDPLNGVSTGPLFLIQQYIVNGPGAVGQFDSPYQLVASDADCDDGVDVFDIVTVQQVIVGDQNTSLCKSWAFVPEYYTLENSFSIDNETFVLTYPEQVTVNQIEDDTTFNFVGVKVGDILGNADPANFTGGNGPVVDTRSTLSLPLQATDRSLEAGEYFELPLRSTAFEDMGSLQLALEYATDKLEFLGFESAEQAIQPVHRHDATGGKLQLSWVDPSAQGLSLGEEDAVLTPRFRALTDVGSLSELLWVNTNVLRAEAMSADLAMYRVELGWESLTSTAPEAQADGYFLYQNAPNPAQGETRIKFSLPSPQRATLEVIDSYGRVIAQYEQSFPAGFSEIVVPTRQLQAGFYQYRLRTSEYTGAKSMIVE